MLLVRMRMNIHTVVLTHTHTQRQFLLKSIKKHLWIQHTADNTPFEQSID